MAYVRGSIDQTCIDMERHHHIHGVRALDRQYPCGGTQEASFDLDCNLSWWVCLQDTI